MIIIGSAAALPITKSLAKLLDAQQSATCFHELNPACMRYTGTPQPVRNTITEFKAILAGGDRRYLTLDHTRPDAVATYNALLQREKMDLLGDVAHYYLQYIEEIAAFDPEVRFVCVEIERQAAIDAWVHKASVRRWPARTIADRLTSLVMRTPYYTTQNYWVDHDGSRWKPDPMWNKCFPDYQGESVAEVVGLFWDDYYRLAGELAEKLSGRFMLISPQTLNSREGQREILDFSGVPTSEQRYTAS